MIMIEYNLLLSLLIFTVRSIYTTPPLWVTSNYFRAGNQDVILGITSQTTTPIPNHNFTFSPPLSGTPNLGYGIKAYQGWDYLGEQMFQVNRTYLDRFQFRVTVQIKGTTFILHLNVPYIAIDPSFPHHVNSFDNVPVNYLAGNLVNISVSSTSVQTYRNTINYTLQATGLHYNTFLTPYSRNKVLLFMTSINFNGENQRNSGQLRPINLTVSADVISSSQYLINVQLGSLVNISLLHFSIIVFDQVDVESSGLYVLVYDRITLPYTGGFIPLPVEFKNNFILGMLCFTTNKTQSILDLQWDFSYVNGNHGVFMPLSVAETNRNFGTNTISTITYTMFYIKTWICPNQTYFDPAQDLCSGCPIINCLNCYNISVCQNCDQLNDFFLNLTDYHCIPCTLQGCKNCTNLTTCQQCNTTGGYTLLSNGTCFLCSSIANNFLNTSTNQCEMCSIPDCLICLNFTVCSQCNATSLYYLNSGSTCSYCDPTAGYSLLSNGTCFLCSSIPNNFLNTTSNQCQLCTITGCFTCLSLTQCSICNASALYYKNSGSTCSYCDPNAGYALLSSNICFLCSNIPNNFLNLTTNACQMCSLTGCLTCFNLSSCSICDQPSQYYLDTGSNCSYCDPTAGYSLLLNGTCFLCSSIANNFLNTSTNQCEMCSIPDCLICLNFTVCSQCNATSLYYLNSGSTCSYCDPTAGYSLLSNGTCFLCSSIPNNFLNTTSNQCQLCTITGCFTCLSLTQCSICNASALYYKNSGSTCSYCDPNAGYALLSSNICFLCSNIPNNFLNLTTNACQMCSLTGCLTCFNLSSCSICDQPSQYYLDTGSNCSYCDPTAGYSLLLNGTCFLCSSIANNFLNTSTNQCEMCSIPDCLICLNFTVCSQCNATSLYYLNSGSTCSYCDPTAGYSLLSNGTCFLCSSIPNNFLNTTSNQCQLCTITGCFTCLSLTQCSICNASALYYKNSGSTCSYCDPNAGYALLSSNICFLCSNIPNNFLNLTTNACQMCSLTGCLTCFNLSSCSICDQPSQYYLDTGSNCSYCDPTAGYSLLLNGTCFLCSTLINTFINQTTYQCEVCSLVGCQICFKLTQCSVCDYNNSYYLNQNTTCSLCNNLNYFLNQTTLTCESCNIIGCKICQNFENCSVCDTKKGYYLNDSLCYDCTYFDNCSTIIEGTQIQTYRSGCNSFIFKYKLSSQLKGVMLQQFYFINEDLTIMDLQINEQILQGNVSYSTDIYKQRLQLVIPSLSQTIVFQYNPILPSLYFTQQQCKTKQNVQKLLQGIQITSYILLFMSLLSCKIVGLQLFGVLQLAYISLASYDFYDMYLYPITQFKTFNGLSLSLFSQQSSLPSHLTQMKLSSNFVNNCNIMLILLLGQLLLAMVLYMISKLAMSQRIKTVSLHLLKQGFITLIFFNIFNISFSTGIQFKYAQNSGTNFIINVLIIVISFIFILVSTLAMQLTNPTQYGQYKNKFKEDWVCMLYIPISFVYRVCLGLFIALKNDYEYATLLILAVSFLFIMYNIINLPFKNPIHNYRCNLAHITHLVTLFSANYYRAMKMNTPMEIKGRDHSVAILQLVMLVLTLIVSIIVLVYEICHDLREYLKKRKISEQNNRIKNASQLTIQDIIS